VEGLTPKYRQVKVSGNSRQRQQHQLEWRSFAFIKLSENGVETCSRWNLTFQSLTTYIYICRPQR